MLHTRYHNNRIFVLSQVKDKQPAEQQITAEQLLREAKERELEILPPVSYGIVNIHANSNIFVASEAKDFRCRRTC